jgi:hypothetical protein
LAAPSAFAEKKAAAEQGSFNMTVEEVREEDGTIRIRTTGAEIVFDKAAGVIECHQRIPVSRKVATISGLSLADARVESKTSAECRIATGESDASPMIVSMDSLISIPVGAGTAATITGAYKPAYQGREGTHFLLPDEEGGIGIYALGGATCEAPAEWEPGWELQYTSGQAFRLLVSVFPPRPFDWKQSYETIVHTFSWKNPYPSDDQLREWSRHGSILVLHSWIWQGTTGSQYGVMMDDSWAVSKYVPKSEKELVRVVKTAQGLGMKVIVYMSPYYFKGGSIDDFVAAVDQAMKAYSLDGVYFDGIVEPYNDIMGAYDVTRKTRDAIGDERILYIHSTISPLKEIYCPFIDCYADYLLRGEHRETSEDGFRWYVSSYNLGNAIGTLCYDTQRPTRELIDLMFRVNARLPYWVDDGTWNKKEYFLHKPEMELMKAEYFPRLRKEANKHE